MILMSQKPLDPAGGESPKIHLRLPVEDAGQLDRLARRRGLTRSAAVRELIHAAIGREAAGPPGSSEAV